ncbi:MAG: ATP synthase F1 subunit gamma [bacterium]|nr:ATP synthase F1 subunit gamma [bacterium]
MANTREIKERISSIKDTMKITNAMYMISTNKLRKAKAALEKTEPYFYTMQSAIAYIMKHFPEIKHPFFDARPEHDLTQRRTGFIVVTADKGLAGAYNHNIIKLATEMLDANKGESSLYVVGQVGMRHFEKHGYSVDEHFMYTAQNPSLGRARRISEFLIGKYINKELDDIYILYTRMDKNTAEPEIRQLLPIVPESYMRRRTNIDIHLDDIPMLPSPEAMVTSLVPSCVTGFIYGALIESYCSEQNMRVMAMQNATDSAKEMLNNLSIEYNRMRQAAITQEITEISAGARAQRKK